MSYFRVSILPHPNPDKPEKSKRTAKAAKGAKFKKSLLGVLCVLRGSKILTLSHKERG